MKQVKKPLHVVVDYKPKSEEDEWKLQISVNDNFAGEFTIVPYLWSYRDLSVAQIVEYIKEQIEEELSE